MSVTALRKNATIREQVTEAEWQARVDLAAAYRALAYYGVQDLTYNHLSLRVPGEADRLLIKPHGFLFEEVTASTLLKYDFDGNAVFEGDPPLKGGGLVIHAGLLKARSDVDAVFHTHTPAVMGVSAHKHGLLPINQHSMRFYERIAYHNFGGFEFDMAMRKPLIEDLGEHLVALLRNHGALVCGRTVKEAFVLHHFLEMACRGQVAALSAGEGNYVMPPHEVCVFSRDQIGDLTYAAGDKDWPAVLRLAERLDPGFKD
jgi:ribulose-5-phosphate 4-epimerase/fuculose-1-phosphate aldolase